MKMQSNPVDTVMGHRRSGGGVDLNDRSQGHMRCGMRRDAQKANRRFLRGRTVAVVRREGVRACGTAKHIAETGVDCLPRENVWQTG